MPKGKKKISAFGLFLQEQRQGGPAGIVVKLHPDHPKFFGACEEAWNNLSPEDKSRYAQAAKEKKAGSSVKVDLSDPPVKPLDMGSRSSNIGSGGGWSQQDQTDYVLDLVDRLDLADRLWSQKFYLAHFSYLVEDGKGNFLPCEISVAEYSLERGITALLHTFINPGVETSNLDFSIKYAAEMKTGVDVQAAPLKTPEASDWPNILNSLIRFVLPGEDKGDHTKRPVLPVFVKESRIARTRAMMDKLQELANSGEDGAKDVLVSTKADFLQFLPLKDLFINMAKVAASCMDPLPTPEQESPAAPFDPLIMDHAISSATAQIRLYGRSAYTAWEGGRGQQDIRCQWHSSEGNHGCSKAMVKSWAFIISKHCCPALGIPLLEHHHRPGTVGLYELGSEDSGIAEVNLCPMENCS